MRSTKVLALSGEYYTTGWIVHLHGHIIWSPQIRKEERIGIRFDAGAHTEILIMFVVHTYYCVNSKSDTLLECANARSISVHSQRL